MRAWSLVGQCVGAAAVCLAVPAAAQPPANQTPAQAAPATRVSMADAVRLALEHNHQLRAQRLNVDLSKADEITAGAQAESGPHVDERELSGVLAEPASAGTTSPTTRTSSSRSATCSSAGGKREKRTLVAQDTTTVAAQDRGRRRAAADVPDRAGVHQRPAGEVVARPGPRESRELLERGRREPRAACERAISPRPSSTRSRCRSCSSSRTSSSARGRARAGQGRAAAERRLREPRRRVRRGRRSGVHEVHRHARRPEAGGAGGAARPARGAGGVKLAQDTQALAFSNRARDVTGEVEYDRAGPLNAVGFGVSIDLPFHDRNQGNIAHSKVADSPGDRDRSGTPGRRAHRRRQRVRDVSDQREGRGAVSVRLPRSGAAVARHHDLRVSAAAAGTLLDLLDAERTYRDDAAGVPPGARGVHDERPANQFRGRKAGDAMRARSSRLIVALALSACAQRPPSSAGSNAPGAKAAAPAPRRPAAARRGRPTSRCRPTSCRT